MSHLKLYEALATKMVIMSTDSHPPKKKKKKVNVVVRLLFISGLLLLIHLTILSASTSNMVEVGLLERSYDIVS